MRMKKGKLRETRRGGGEDGNEEGGYRELVVYGVRQVEREKEKGEEG